MPLTRVFQLALRGGVEFLDENFEVLILLSVRTGRFLIFKTFKSGNSSARAFGVRYKFDFSQDTC